MHIYRVFIWRVYFNVKIFIFLGKSFKRTFSRHKKSGYKNKVFENQLLKNNLIIGTTILYFVTHHRSRITDSTIHHTRLRQPSDCVPLARKTQTYRSLIKVFRFCSLFRLRGVQKHNTFPKYFIWIWTCGVRVST